MALMDREMTLNLAQARGLECDTAMALLFLRGKDYLTKARGLEELKEELERLDTSYYTY